MPDAGKIRFSCLHWNKPEDEWGFYVQLKGQSRDCRRAIDCMTVCKACYERIRANGENMTDEEADDWLADDPHDFEE